MYYTNLREHKFQRSFQDTLNPIFNCGNDVESAIHFFLHCPIYSNERGTLLSSLVNIDHTLLDHILLTQILLFGNATFNAKENTKIINLTIGLVLSTKRFDEPLFMNSVFDFSLNDSSDNKRILCEASPGLLIHQRLFTGW